MHLTLLKQLFEDQIVNAICWTLIHSLWEGLVLAIIAGLVLIFTKKSTSGLRYNLLVALFFLFALGAGYTFLKQLQPNVEIMSSGDTRNLIDAKSDSQAAPQTFTIFREIGQDYGDKMVFYFNTHASLVVTIWFIIISARLIKFLAGIGYIQRVKHYKTHLPSIHWKRKMQELVKRLEIKERVTLLESELVKVPVVAGILKPVILFPFSMLSQLPPDQVEAVLLHELAHIKRSDYFVNLLQNLAEIIFFFNPAVLWISSIIREERENCCDDIAIDTTKSKEKFIQALVSFQEYNMSPLVAMAFPGQKNHLLNRVKRIVTNHNKTLNNMEKILLSTGIVLTAFISATFSQPKQPAVVVDKTADLKVQTMAENPVPPAPPVPPTLTDTVPTKKNHGQSKSSITLITTTAIEGKQYKLIEENGRVTELYVNGKRIPESKIKDYRLVIDQIKSRMQEDASKLEGQTAKLEKEQELLAAEAEKLSKEQEKTLENGKATRDALAEKIAQLSLQQDKFKLEAQEVYNKQMIRLQAQENLNEVALKLKNIEVNTPKGVKHVVIISEPVELEVRAVVPPSKLDKSTNSIIADLIEEKLITNEEEFSFTLNQDELIVNNVKQPAELHAKMKEKYIRGPKDHIIYSRTKNSSHSDVYVDKPQ